MKEIKGFDMYLINENGEIFSKIKNRIMKPYKSTTCNYLCIDLRKDGKRYKKLVHRLVAETFIDNLDNKPEVDHIDNNTFNNNVNNLRWVTRKENLYKSYKTMSPTRNYKECNLYKGDKLIGSFKSIKECTNYCSEKLGLSKTSMDKYRKYKDYYIIKV